VKLGNFWQLPHQKERQKLSFLGKCLYVFFKQARDKDSNIRIALHNNSQRDENSISVLLEIPDEPKQSQQQSHASLPFNIKGHVLITILLDGQIRFSAYENARNTADKRTILDLKNDDTETLFDQIVRKIVNDHTGMFDINGPDVVRAVEGKRTILHEADTLFSRFNLR